MSLSHVILGKPIAPAEEKKQKLSVWTGLSVLGLDALASTGYGPEAALTTLATAGLFGIRYFWIIAVCVVAQLVSLYFSYRQTAEAYPDGGGAYSIAKANFGAQPALWAAVALLLDYLLNVAVAISAGVGAVVSAAPVLHPYALPLCLFVLLTLTLVNLRGIRQSGLIFVLPTFAFVASMAVAMGIGLVQALTTGGHPRAVVAPPPLPHATTAIGAWLLLRSFANGCTAMTGIEAVSNGVPLFSDPKAPNARRTLTAIVLILSAFLLALGYLCAAYHIWGMNEQQPGYQTVLSQLVAAVAGRNLFYYVSLTSIFIVLTYSAQTSFTDFPRVCHFLAKDRFLPSGFSERNGRLVYWKGIVVLAVFSAVLLIVFGGITDKLIPLFAVGAFTAFLFSQAGMVRHWLRRRGPRYRIRLFFNGLGAAITFVVLVIIIVAKFKEGAWVIVLVGPGAVLVLKKIARHSNAIEH